MEREVNGIIQKYFRSIIGYKVDDIPEGKKKPSLAHWIKDAEKERYDGFGEMVIFTENDRWLSEKVIKTYNQKSLVEDDFKLLNDAFLVQV